MKPAGETIDLSVVRSQSRLADFWTLSKPELSLLSLLTTLAGYFCASQHGIVFGHLALTLLGTGLLAAGAAALNMYVEREYDGQMRRTQKRPLPSGRMKPGEALLFGILTGVTGAFLLATTINLLTAALGVVTYASYVFVYTPLKRKSTWNTLVGCIPGAIPPIMGWSAVRNDLSLDAWALFAILFMWQMPHFLSLAWMYRADYKRGGFKMLPTEEAEDGMRTSIHILVFCALLIPASLLPVVFGMSGMIYTVVALLLGVSFFALSIVLVIRRTNELARRVFFASLIYIPALFIILMIDKA